MADTASKKGTAALSVMSNTLLVILKLVVGIITGSVSILAEAIHSGVDLVAAVIAYVAVLFADRPPDEAHAYGHGKYENISGTVEAILIIIAAVYIAYEAIIRITNRAEVEQVGIGIIVMLISAAANWFVSARLFKVAGETDSIALEADGHHLRLDVYTSAGILVGLLVVYITGISLIDQLLGLAVAVWIGWIGLQLSSKAVGPLLDQQLPAQEVERIASIIHSEPGVLGYHKLRTRKSGAHRHVDVHIIVPKTMSLTDAHNLAEDIEDKVRAEFEHTFILTHVEPEDAVSARGSLESEKDG